LGKAVNKKTKRAISFIEVFLEIASSRTSFCVLISSDDTAGLEFVAEFAIVIVAAIAMNANTARIGAIKVSFFLILISP